MGWKAPTYAVHIVIKVIIYKSRGYLSLLEATHNSMCAFSLFGHEMSSEVAYFSLP